jgi:hypothetical protein
MIADKISYLASCYQADIRAVSLLNFFSKRVEHQLFLETADLLSGEYRKLYPVPTLWAKGIEKTMAVYGKEKSLYCCAVFLAGTADIAGKTEAVMAPVYLYPAELVFVDDIYHIAIYEENPIINPAIVEVEPNSDAGKYDSLSSALPKGFLDAGKMTEIIRLLTAFFPKWDAASLRLFPQLINEAGAKMLLKQAQAEQKFSFLPALGLCLIDKPSGSRGILNELDSMAGRGGYSKAIQALLNQTWHPAENKPFNQFHVPALLSQRQAAILGNVGRWPLQLVIGPPGTGKSFTIAALAVEMLSRGKSVLIASKNDEACNVVADKIERDLDIAGIVIRASRRDYKNELQRRLQNLLNGIDLIYVDRNKLKQLEKRQKQLHAQIEALEKKIVKLQEQRLVDGVFLHQFDGGVVQKIQKAWVSWRHENLTPLWKLTEQLELFTHERHVLLRNYLKCIFNHYLGKALDQSRIELQAMVNAAKARTGNRKELYFDSVDFSKVLKALPIWTVNTADVHRVLPLQKEMFDLVIIDEATQCDIASSLPILQRGKSAIVVGDPKQLRHLSFLSNRQQQALAEQFKLPDTEVMCLNYRENSLLDVVSMTLQSQESVHFLDEHYRSMPDIIAFSNEQFYSNRLHIMTAKPITQSLQHLFIHKIMGKRLAQGHNPKEADYIIQEVSRIMESEAALEPFICKTIGIISPFREQVNYLQRQVDKEFSVEQMKRHRLMVGTPFAFQGEERDVVYLSLVLDNTTHPSAFLYLNRADVFNVSITRARTHQQVLVSFDPELLTAASLVRQYVSHAETQISNFAWPSNTEFQHAFLESIKAYLYEIGVQELYTAYPVAGIQVDIVALVNGRTYGIDLIGHPSHWGEVLQLEEWKMLCRTGMPLFYLPYSEWYLDEARVKRAIAAFLGLSLVFDSNSLSL